MLKTGIGTFSGAVTGNMELKKRLTQNIIPGMIIKAQDGVTNSIMIDFKSLCSKSTAYQHGEGKLTDRMYTHLDIGVWRCNGAGSTGTPTTVLLQPLCKQRSRQRTSLKRLGLVVARASN
jgi:hypothetical protein